MTPGSKQPQEPHRQHIYLKTAKPEDFMNAKIGDWIQYVGDISTNYQLDFIRNFGGFLCAAHPAAPVPISDQLCKGESCVYKKFAKNWKNGEEHDALVAQQAKQEVLDEAIALLEKTKKRFSDKEMELAASIKVSQRFGAARLGVESSITALKTLRQSKGGEQP
jgi:hypothetical protein